MSSHWFPRLNTRGDVARGHNTINVNGVELTEGIAPQWYRDELLMVKRFDDLLYLMDPVTGSVGAAVAGPVVSFAAGGNEWLSRLPGSPMITVAVSREGQQAWVIEYNGSNSDHSVFVEDVPIIEHRAVDWVRLEGECVVWSDQATGRVWGADLREGPGPVLCLQLAQTPELRGVPIPTPDGPWILSMTHTELRLAPWGSHMGYCLTLGDNQNLDPDAVYLDGKIRVVWYDGVAIAPGQADVDLSTPRSDLLTITPEPPVEPPVEPPIESVEPPVEPIEPPPIEPEPEPQPPLPEVPVQVALSQPSYINWRWSGGQSLEPPTNPDDPNREPFEFNRPTAGVDEWAELIEVGDYYAVRSPNGRSWLSVQEDGSLQERDATGDPGEWELFTLDNGVLIEKPKEGVTRPPTEFIA